MISGKRSRSLASAFKPLEAPMPQSKATQRKLRLAALFIVGISATLSSAGCADDTPKLTVPTLAFCSEPRPQMCTELYQPVCGVTKAGQQQTYGNACTACTHPEVIRYTPGECKTS
jgi:Kazal-type serine protease inhibitor domain